MSAPCRMWGLMPLPSPPNIEPLGLVVLKPVIHMEMQEKEESLGLEGLLLGGFS